LALRLIFMGTPEFAVPTLAEIVGRGHEVAAVYTRAPKPAGRGMAMQPSPVEREARRLGLPVLTPKTLRTPEAEAMFRAHGADAAVVVAYGLILPKAILDALPRGAFNLHASLLPRWRGAAPINRAIMASDRETGVMVMRMEEGLDTGPVALGERVLIGRDMTAGELHDVLAPLGASLIGRALEQHEQGADAHAAGGGGRHLCGENRQERDAHRLGEAVAAGARSCPRPVAVSRRLVRDRGGGQVGAREDFAHDAGRRLGRGRDDR
jgi:methionyl-tRNA formyltransferase